MEGTIIEVKVGDKPIGRILWPNTNRYLSHPELQAKIQEHWKEFSRGSMPDHCFIDYLTDHEFDFLCDNTELTVSLSRASS